MKSFREFIADLLLVEMAFDKKTMENKISALENQINLHLIKIIRYDDELNRQKHINDVMNWLEQIQDLDFNKKNNKFSKDLYFKLLFKEPFTDSSNITLLKNWESRGSLKDYLDLPRKKTEEETMFILENLHIEISKLLSRNEIYDIEFELNKL
jgi:hypothetical protein